MLNFTLEDIKNASGITGDYQNATLQEWVDETVDFLRDAGVAESNITCGIVARGVFGASLLRIKNISVSSRINFWS